MPSDRQDPAGPRATPLGRLRTPDAIRRVDGPLLRAQAAEAARRARRRLALVVPLVAALIAAYTWRVELFGVDRPARIVTAIALVALSWPLASGLAGALVPRMTRRMEPSTAGVASFLVRLFILLMTVIVSMRLAGLPIATVALGASFTAVVVGLAAQQTLGNVFAGLVLLAARPFRVGDRVRFAGFGMDVEGTVVSHGLLYVTCHDGDDLVLVPNNTALTMSVRPIREPTAVDMRARLPVGTDPVDVEERVAETVTVETKGSPEVLLEEYDGDEVVVRLRATPRDRGQGGQLAREVLAAVAELDDERAAA